MKRTFFVIVISLLALTLKSQPTGFPKPMIWLKASDFQNNAGQWPDVSGNKNHALTTSSLIKTDRAYLNYNPSVVFNSPEDYFEVPLDRSNKSTQLSFITVYLPGESATERNIWAITEGNLSALSTKVLTGPRDNANYFGGDLSSPIISIARQNWGKPDQNTGNGIIQLGGSIEDNDAVSVFKGNIAELLVFDKILENKDIQMVGTYLSLKYGTTFYLDYINSKGETILTQDGQNGTSRTEGREGYRYRVFGIGRDDGFGLYQKQASNKNEAGLLTIAAGSIMSDNNENTFELNRYEFLLFSDNGGEIENAPVPDEGFQTKLPVMDRQYQANTIGTSLKNIPTELAFNADGLLSDSPFCYLILDRSGTDNFSADETEYILPDEMDENGKVTFKNFQWDTDSSGTDSYTFSTGFIKNKAVIVGNEDEVLYFTNAEVKQKFKSTRGNFLLSATITSLPANGILKQNDKLVSVGDQIPIEGELNYSFEPEPDWNGKAVFNWTGAVDYSISGLPGLSVSAIEGEIILEVAPVNDLPIIDHFIKGTDETSGLRFAGDDFTSVFTDVDGDKLSWIQITELPKSGTLGMGAATLNIGDKIAKEQLGQIKYTPDERNLLYDSFSWNASDGTEYAASSKTAGIVLASKDKLRNNGGGISSLVYPNPASDLFRVTILLDNESGVALEIFNSIGQPVLFKDDSKKSSTLFNYEFSGFRPGLYYIKIKTPTESQSLKLIVN